MLSKLNVGESFTVKAMHLLDEIGIELEQYIDNDLTYK
jgi:hypothetical protein